ncbi:MAG: flagellar hook-length control protein FliK [Sphingomonadaceae bacterium]
MVSSLAIASPLVLTGGEGATLPAATSGVQGFAAVLNTAFAGAAAPAVSEWSQSPTIPLETGRLDIGLAIGSDPGVLAVPETSAHERLVPEAPLPGVLAAQSVAARVATPAEPVGSPEQTATAPRVTVSPETSEKLRAVRASNLPAPAPSSPEITDPAVLTQAAAPLVSAERPSISRRPKAEALTAAPHATEPNPAAPGTSAMPVAPVMTHPVIAMVNTAAPAVPDRREPVAAPRGEPAAAATVNTPRTPDPPAPPAAGPSAPMPDAATVHVPTPDRAPPGPFAEAVDRVPTALPTVAKPALAEPVVAAQPGRIGREIGVEIARRVADGGTELILRLVPAELGRIDVRMAFDEAGGLRAVIAADNAVALDMLRRDSADLSRSLSDAGVRSDAQSLRFQTESGSTGGGNQQRAPWRDPGAELGPVTRDGTFEDLAEPVRYRQVRTSGTYDLLA